MNIPLNRVAPSSLHVLLGVAGDYFTMLEETAEQIDNARGTTIKAELDAILMNNHIDRRAWHQIFTGMLSKTLRGFFIGNHVHKLLTTQQILEDILSLFPIDHEEYILVNLIIDLMFLLGQIQTCATARFFDDVQLNAFKDSLKQYKDYVFSVIPRLLFYALKDF